MGFMWKKHRNGIGFWNQVALASKCHSLDKLLASLSAKQSKVPHGPQYLPAKHHPNASGWADPLSPHPAPVSLAVASLSQPGG